MRGELMQRSDRQPVPRPVRQLVVLNGLHFFNDGYQAALLMLLPIIAASASLSAWKVGLLATAHLSLGVILPMPAVWISQRMGRMNVLVGAVAIYAVAFSLLPWVTSLWSLVPLYLLAGAAFGIFHPLAFALVAELSTSERLGQTMGLFTAAGDVGRAALSVLVAALLAIAAWQTAYGWLGVIALSMMVVLMASQSARRPSCGVAAVAYPPHRATTSKNSIRPQFSRAFLNTCAVGFLDAIVGSGLVVFLPLLWAAKGLAANQISVALTGFFAASLSGKVLFGKVSDRIGKQVSVGICQATLGAVIFASALVSNEPSLMLLGSLAGLASKGSLPVLMAISAEQLTTPQRSHGFGMNQMLLGFATAVSPLLYGAVQSIVGIEFAFGVFALIAGANVILSRMPVHRLSAQATAN